MAGLLAPISFPPLTRDKPDRSLSGQFMARTILFICTGNVCRSPMAEGLFRCLIEENKADLIVKSAGVGAEDGHVYGRDSLLQFFARCKAEGRPVVSPQDMSTPMGERLAPAPALAPAESVLHLREVGEGERVVVVDPAVAAQRLRVGEGRMVKRLDAIASHVEALSDDFGSPGLVTDLFVVSHHIIA